MPETEQKFDPILDLAIQNGFVDDQMVAELREEQQRTGHQMRDLLLDMEVASEEEILAMLAAYQGCDVIDLAGFEIPPDTVQSIPARIARMYNVIPVYESVNMVQLASFDLVDPQMADELAFVLNRDVSFVLGRKADIQTRIKSYYGEDDSDSVNDLLSSLEDEIQEGDEVSGDDEGLADSTPVKRFVNLVLFQAVNDRASDIHFEPFEKEFKIRYRVDGALYEMPPPPLKLSAPVISRIKVMANLNIAEHRIPQDSRIEISVSGRQIDMRVSCLPTQFGESVVLRVLDRSTVSLDLENLGMPEDVYDSLSLDVDKPNGIVIVTGPTGSGKTTTLYSCLRRINRPGRKLLTAEEPIEYDIDGIVQVPINYATGNTFAKVLRAFLRQDPDVMMIGEIRDLETAEIAVQASLTGHLMFSTLHTNDAAGAVTRLVDMDVPPFLIASTLEAVLGQRLVRTICENCKTPYQPDEELLEKVGLSAEDVSGRPFYYGRGCPKCNETGYKGRKGLYEYLAVSEPIRDMINSRQPTLVIRERARELGMRTMREDGVRNILDGYTTVDEIVRYT